MERELQTPLTEKARRRKRLDTAEKIERAALALEPRLEAIARRRGCADHAPDLAQSTLVDTIFNLRKGSWRGEGPVQAYVSTILRRKINKFRSAQREMDGGQCPDTLPAPGPDPLRAVEDSERRARLFRALKQLSSAHRQIVLLHYFEEIGVSEIARMLGVPRGTVLSRLHYARRTVARLLRPRARGTSAA